MRVGEANTKHLRDAAGGQQPHILAFVTLHKGLHQDGRNPRDGVRGRLTQALTVQEELETGLGQGGRGRRRLSATELLWSVQVCNFKLVGFI